MEANELCLGCMAIKGEASTCPYCGWVEGTQSDSGQHLEPGTILRGKYLLGRVLGQGGFGITYLAWDLDLNIKLAIKEYLPRDFATRGSGDTRISIYTSGDSQAFFNQGRDKFLEEARILARFEGHPNIVSVRDFFRENDTAYFVMNYIEGLTFKEYLQEQGGRLDFNKTLQVMMPVMDALEEIHKTGLLHRDISPDNIFITEKGIVKVLDFGAARQALGEHSKSLSVILKPGYAPEEQYRSKGKQGPWTDVYATGATFYRALTGQIPPEALDRMAEDTLLPPTQMGAVLPEAAEGALLKALSVQAGLRFQAMKEFQQALASNWKGPEAVIGSAAQAAPAEKALEPLVVNQVQEKKVPAIVLDQPGRKKSMLILVGALVLIVALGGWFIKSKYSPHYTGGTVNGMKEGTGTMIWPNGNTYQGEWKNDLQNGSGVFTYYYGDKYEGQWKAGKQDGQGTYTWADGRKYVGQWREDMRDGQGVYTWPNGDRFEGQFQGGKMNGPGVYTKANGQKQEGIWQNDVYSGK
ncbi:MAG TPA: protein kinase [Syntrophomonadaceae bacterium]|nr:protein kinase [Syntrophomonadaceae bacterium]